MPDGTTDVFAAQRPVLLRLAYRMLGSHSDADDVVQDAWMRWQSADHAQISNHAVWLTRMV